MMPKRLECLFGGHQWHIGWDAGKHEPLWTGKRCGKVKVDIDNPPDINAGAFGVCSLAVSWPLEGGPVGAPCRGDWGGEPRNTESAALQS